MASPALSLIVAVSLEVVVSLLPGMDVAVDNNIIVTTFMKSFITLSPLGYFQNGALETLSVFFYNKTVWFFIRLQIGFPILDF